MRAALLLSLALTLPLDASADNIAIQLEQVRASGRTLEGAQKPCPPKEDEATPPPAAPKVPAYALETADSVVAKIKLDGSADFMCTGAGAVWVPNTPSGTVSKIDPRTNKVVARIQTGDSCRGCAVGEGSVWVPACGDGKLVRIDPGTGRVVGRTALKMSDSEGSIGAGEGGVWVITDTDEKPSSQLTRVDPTTGNVVARIALNGASAGVAVGFGAIWVSNTEKNTVSKIDPRTNKVVAEIAVHGSPRFIAAGEGGVWVLNQDDGSVSRIDPATGTVAATIDARLPGGGGDLSAGEGSVWITMPGTPVTRINPMTNTITESYRGSAGDALRAGLGAVWLPHDDELWRIDPSRSPAPVPPPPKVDAP